MVSSNSDVYSPSPLNPVHCASNIGPGRASRLDRVVLSAIEPEESWTQRAIK
ncbi:hypothetical protein HPP92_009071 [Vanilla planifolia]|uniref:Uncharacterized protein n=1 Tax=Vanilla planifolia TaxID=51239 RepID=A0A835RFI1_VANPL|nr:hypothetical protein HPP92_009071 [Vanilla planifolia]